MRSLRTAMKSSSCSLQQEKACGSNENPTQAKINKIKKRKNKTEAMCASQWIILDGIWCWFVLLLVMLTLITWLGWCLPGFSTVNLLFSHLWLVNIMGGRYFEFMQISCFSSYFCLLTLASINDSHLQQLLLWYLLKVNLFVYLFLNFIYFLYRRFLLPIYFIHISV